ncbi:MAG: flagellar export protein FliJ [Planctomycetia bacterium]|nr:flagellar export protein FliJ [Planctomycetia bacterium]
MGFQFRFGTIQKVKKNVRDEKRADFQDSLHTQLEISTRLDQLCDELQQLETERTELFQKGIISMSLLVFYHQCESELHRQITRTKQELADASALSESRRTSLLQADCEVKSFEKLEDRRRLQYEENLARREARLCS